LEKFSVSYGDIGEYLCMELVNTEFNFILKMLYKFSSW